VWFPRIRQISGAHSSNLQSRLCAENEWCVSISSPKIRMDYHWWVPLRISRAICLMWPLYHCSDCGSRLLPTSQQAWRAYNRFAMQNGRRCGLGEDIRPHPSRQKGSPARNASTLPPFFFAALNTQVPNSYPFVFVI
jgi:hypothetical protein